MTRFGRPRKQPQLFENAIKLYKNLRNLPNRLCGITRPQAISFNSRYYSAGQAAQRNEARGQRTIT